MKKLIFLALLFPTVCYGNNYEAAAATAREAFLVQTGIKHHIRLFQRYVAKEAYSLLDEIGILEETAVVAATYQTYNRRQVSFRYKGKRFTLTPNSVSVTMGF